jgi:uncharacterized surface protein with fasciclin (FAS1) repeats
MRHSFTTTAILALILCGASSAQAANAGVASILQSRPELSTFTQAMVKTGVMGELKEGQRYTVFAPTNESFAKAVTVDPSCYQSGACKEKMAALLRNHIIPQKGYVDRLAGQEGGIGTLGTHTLHVEKASQIRSEYSVDGHMVVDEKETDAGLVYSIDGPVAPENELSSLNDAEKDAARGITRPGNAAMAPMVPMRPSLVAPPTR